MKNNVLTLDQTRRKKPVSMVSTSEYYAAEVITFLDDSDVRTVFAAYATLKAAGYDHE